MFQWFRKIQFDQKEELFLEAELRKLSDIQMDVSQRLQQRQRLVSMAQKSSFYDSERIEQVKFGQRVRAVARDVQLDPVEAHTMRVRIMSTIGHLFQHSEDGQMTSKLQRWVAAPLLVALIATFSVITPGKTPIPYAKASYFLRVVGDVTVERNGQRYKAEKDFSLQEGDILHTTPGSFASMRFLDDSVARLEQNSALSVEKLYKQPLNPLVTEVELNLGQGTLTSQVVPLLNDQAYYKVVTSKLEAEATNKATFEVSTSDAQVTIEVYDNHVEVKDLANNGVTSRTVVAGYSLTLDGEHQEIAQVKNMEQGEDLFADDGLEEPQSSEIPVVLTDTIIPDSHLEELRQKFVIAHQQFVQGQDALQAGDVIEGNRLVKSFKYRVSEILVDVRKNTSADEVSRELLMNYMKEKIHFSMKSLALVLPTASQYPAKQIISQVEIMLTDGDFDIIKVQLAQAERGLLEIQDLIQEEKTADAFKAIENYQLQSTRLFAKAEGFVKTLPMAQTEELFTSELRQLKELTALENLLVLSQQNGLKARVHAVQNSSVNRLIVLLKLAPTDEESVKIAQRFLTQLQNFSELYLQDTQKVGDDATERMDELFNENQSKLDEIITDQLLQDSEASGDSQVTPVELEFNHLDSFGGEHS